MKILLPGSEIDEILRPYYAIVKEALTESFNDVLSFKSFVAERGVFINLKPRSKGSMINDSVSARLSQAVFNDQNAKVIDCNGVFGLLIQNKIFLRFNKMNKHFRTSVTRTNQYKSFERGTDQIEGLPRDVTIIWGGFTPNLAWSEIKGYFLCSINGSILNWYFNLKEYMVEQLPIDFEEALKEEVQTTKRRVSPKKIGEDRQTGTEE
ncbi:MAG: hypothetical protein V5804_03350 [Mucilaginibacter sp.]|uniref:hypothetical protein n=1 Tax=Mucilaginibacter sp. TaxID=1882438 RepID=UPI0034E5472A